MAVVRFAGPLKRNGLSHKCASKMGLHRVRVQRSRDECKFQSTSYETEDDPFCWFSPSTKGPEGLLGQMHAGWWCEESGVRSQADNTIGRHAEGERGGDRGHGNAMAGRERGQGDSEE